ncbi:MAG: hypothetical protein IKM62_00005 [Kiritimatiellae bacterium]|nr:hypothetical protein [Kiritimatiellia bacterium]
MLGVSFATIDKTSSGVQVQTIAGNFQENDQIQYWDGAQLKNLTYYNAYGSDPAGWYNADDSLATKTFAPGEGFWVKVAKETDVSIAGKVVTGEEGKVTAPARSFTLLALSYPQPTEINKIAFTGLTENDQIQYWDGTQLKNLTYYNAYGSDPAGWYNADDSLATKTFEPGEGFWICPQKDVGFQF